MRPRREGATALEPARTDPHDPARLHLRLHASCTAREPAAKHGTGERKFEMLLNEGRDRLAQLEARVDALGRHL
jgi:hypothetical protein